MTSSRLKKLTSFTATFPAQGNCLSFGAPIIVFLIQSSWIRRYAGRSNGFVSVPAELFMSSKRLTWFVLQFLASAIFLNGCTRDLGTAQGVVEEFVDQHYVHIDLQKAKAYVVSIALDKVNEEIRLTAGHKIDASTQKPKVNYKLLEKKEGETRASFLYEGKIVSDDGSSFTRKWLILARKEGDRWRVSNFTESD